MTNPVIVLPRRWWLEVLRRNPELLEDLILCLPPYVLLIFLGVGAYCCLYIDVVPASIFVPYYMVNTWARIVILTGLSAWLAAPQLFSPVARAGILRRRQRLASTAILFLSLLVCSATPIVFEYFTGVRVRNTVQTGVLKEWIKYYLESLPGSTYAANFPQAVPLEQRSSFWDEVARVSLASNRYTLEAPVVGVLLSADEKQVVHLVHDLCRIRDLLKMPTDFPPMQPPFEFTECEPSVISLWQNRNPAFESVIASSTSYAGEILGMLFVLRKESSWSWRIGAASTWLWVVSLALFWTAAIRTGGDLARKGMLAALLVELIPILPYRFNNPSLLEIDARILWGIALLLLCIYVYVTKARKRFAAFRWIQYAMAVLPGAATVVMYRCLEPPEIISPAQMGGYLHLNLFAAGAGVVLLIGSELLSDRIRSFAFRPVRK